MAVTTEGSVIRMDANLDTYDNQAKLKICGIKLVGGVDASTAIIRDESASGMILWQGRAGAAADLYDQVCILVDRKIHLSVTGTSPVVYVYRE